MPRQIPSTLLISLTACYLLIGCSDDEPSTGDTGAVIDLSDPGGGDSLLPEEIDQPPEESDLDNTDLDDDGLQPDIEDALEAEEPSEDGDAQVADDPVDVEDAEEAGDGADQPDDQEPEDLLDDEQDEEPDDLLDAPDTEEPKDLIIDTDMEEPEDAVDDEEEELCDLDEEEDSTEPSDLAELDDDSTEIDLADAEDSDEDGGIIGEIVVNSALDLTEPPEGTVTLRSALASAIPGQTIRFDPTLSGTTIELTLIGEEHTILKGEVMGMRMEPSGPVSYLVGYFERDYGRSALYAHKDVVIDASDLSLGITLAWTGGAANPARVLAVYGDLTMTNVNITGGHSVTEALPVVEPEDQPWTLARGGGVAVWGTARLADCTLYDNHCVGDFQSSRDRGAYGGGLYADIVVMEDCVVSGNTVLGGGAAGGGVFSVSGAEEAATASTVTRSTITGNRISGLYAYGGGIYTDGGGIGKSKRLQLTNTTIARNVAEPAPGLSPFLLGMGYWRGGGVYMSNGYLKITSCTIVENETYGYGRTDALGKRNLAGGIAATIGNAHGVESMVIGHSIVAGNTVFELGADGSPTASYAHDIFTGSLLHYQSLGYNRIGAIDFSQILVPVSVWGWRSLCRKHYPKDGDRNGILLAEVLDLTSGIEVSDTILSAGVDPSTPAVLYYRPTGDALDQIPTVPYSATAIHGEYLVSEGVTDNFLSIMLGRIEDYYELSGFAADFTAAFEGFLQSVDLDPDEPGAQPYTDPEGDPILTLADTLFFGPAETWPKELCNYPYIEFWHQLDAALLEAEIPDMGPELLGDREWSALFRSGYLMENPGIYIAIRTTGTAARLADVDQLGVSRPIGPLGDIGAIEMP
ncbi:MAG: hypothetical protein JW797_13690 [Bradymonadales bacterium]|nr:hypothetical protein [Bradymonadales bacterium]